MARIRIEGVVASTRQMEAYGGVSISEPAIRSLADAIKNGSVPLGLHHDPRHRLNADVIDAFTRTSAEGDVQAVAIYEVDEAEWNFRGGASTTGFSASARQPLFGDREAEPVATIAADAHWFSDEQIEGAFDELSKSLGPVHGCRLYQFAAEPTALVTLVLVLQQMSTIPTGLLCSFIYDALKHFVGRQPSKFSVTIRDYRTGKSTHAYLETSSNRVLKHAIDTLPTALDHGGGYDYSLDDERWEVRE